jgi:hypothetical protein
MLYVIHDEFGGGEFSCSDIKNTIWLGEFNCQLLRAWRNLKIVKHSKKKVEGRGRNPITMWRFTDSALYILRNPFVPKS